MSSCSALDHELLYWVAVMLTVAVGEAVARRVAPTDGRLGPSGRLAPPPAGRMGCLGRGLGLGPQVRPMGRLGRGLGSRGRLMGPTSRQMG